MIVLYSKAGNVDNPQNYIINSKLQFYNEIIPFIDSYSTYLSTPIEIVSNKTLNTTANANITANATNIQNNTKINSVTNPVNSTSIGNNNKTNSNLTLISEIVNINPKAIKQITLRFTLDFIELKQNDFTLTRSNPPFSINFPFNFTNPFSNI